MEHVEARKEIVPSKDTQNKNYWKILSKFAPRPPTTPNPTSISYSDFPKKDQWAFFYLTLFCNCPLLWGSLTLPFREHLLSSIQLLGLLWGLCFLYWPSLFTLPMVYPHCKSWSTFFWWTHPIPSVPWKFLYL